MAPVLQAIDEIQAALRLVVAEVQPDELDTADAAAAVVSFAAIERLAAAGKVLVAAKAASGSAWRRGGHRTPEDWLAAEGGTTIGAAKAALEAGERLHELPDTEAAARKGELSEEQLSEVAAAGKASPDGERKALQAARERKPLSKVRDERRRAEAAARSKEDEQERQRRIHRNRYFRRHTEADGSVRLDGRVSAEAAAEIFAGIAPHQRRAFECARANGSHESAEAYAADGLVAMARTANGAPDAAGRRPDVKLLIRADAAALERGWTEPGELCEIEGVGPIPVDIARCYANEAFWAVVVMDGEDVRSVTHLGRRCTARQRTALELRDRCCVVPGCGQTFGLEIHHVDDWHLTLHTKLDELGRACWHHHGMLTRGEATLARLPDARWRFTVKGGAVREGPPPTPAPPPPPAAADTRQLALVG